MHPDYAREIIACREKHETLIFRRSTFLARFAFRSLEIAPRIVDRANTGANDPRPGVLNVVGIVCGVAVFGFGNIARIFSLQLRGYRGDLRIG